MTSFAAGPARPWGRRWLVCRLFAGGLALLSGCGGDREVKPTLEALDPIMLPLVVGSAWEYTVADTTNGTPNLLAERTDSLMGVRPFDGTPFFALVTRSAPPETTWVRQEAQRLLIRPSLLSELPVDSTVAGLADSLRASLPWLLADFQRPAGAGWELLTVADTLELSGYPVRVAARVTATSLGRRALTVPAGRYDDVAGSRLTMQISYTVLIPLFPVPGGAYTRWEEIYAGDGVGIVQWRSGERTEVPGVPTTSFTSTARLRRFRPGPG